MKSERVRVKMCGMTRKVDLIDAINLGVDAVGLIFYSGSSRYVTQEQARELLDGLMPFVQVVAVLVNPDRDFVDRILSQLPVSLLQFHGEESPEFCQSFGFPYIKSIPAQSTRHIEESVLMYQQALGILLDTSSAQRGGTGLTFDWSMIPETLSKPCILAGGINEINVQEAITSVHPFAIDVCSGIEKTPGIKDYKKMKQLIDRVWGTK